MDVTPQAPTENISYNSTEMSYKPIVNLRLMRAPEHECQVDLTALASFVMNNSTIK